MNWLRVSRLFVLLMAFTMLWGGTNLAGQPDPRQMSGLPLPDRTLPDGTITVRVIRGQITNNVPDQLVELRQGDSVQTARTDGEGRATFLALNAGQPVQASTELDGQPIQSQSFLAPGPGGIRVMLVGADLDSPVLPVQAGTVTLGDESWIQVELIEESVEVYYFLQVVNPGVAPVDSPVPIAFDLPSGAVGTTVLRGGSPRALVDGRHVELPGPFAPGATPLHVAYILPYSGESLAIAQSFPIDLEALLISVEKWGALDVVSAQIERRMELPASEGEGSPHMLVAGPRIVTGRPLSVELIGLPSRSRVPSNATLIVAIGILGCGIWGASGRSEMTATSRHRVTLEVRKEKLLTDLVKVERQHRAGKIGSTKHTTRRGELVGALERVYRDLDDELVAVMRSSSPVQDSPVARRSGTA
jgi:hypothetical protein